MSIEIPMSPDPLAPSAIPSSDQLTISQAIASAIAAKNAAQLALADIPAAIDAEVGPASAPYISQSEAARDAAVVAKTAAETARDNALATERRMRQQSLGQFANDAAAEAWAAAQSPAITIITGSSYLNTTSDIFRYAVVSAGPTIVWHDVTEDEAAQAVLAQASATAAAASLSTMLTKLVGAFSTDPTYVGDSPPWVVGALYFNTLSNKLKVWTSGSVWAFYDAAAQTAATSAAYNATVSTAALTLFQSYFCGASATDPTVDGAGNALTTAAFYFNTVSGKMRTRATGAWVDYDSSAQAALTSAIAQVALATAQAGIATTKASDASTFAAAALAAYNNANALLSSVSASAIIAQQAAASALVATNLSILAAAQRAIKISSALVAGAAVPYDTTKDEVSDWPRKCVSQSYLSDTLNTATRGTVAAVPAQMVVMGETTVLSVFMGTDGLGALWKSWTVAGLTCVFARSGSIWYGGTGGLYRLDLITDEVYKRDTSGLWLCINQKVADYNQGTATWSLVSSAGAIASATVNSVAATVLPLTPPSPARFGLPNPTVAVATASAVNTIRADGVVVADSFGATFTSVAFDLPGQGNAPNLWSLQSTGAVYVSSQYLGASWVINNVASFTAAQLGIGTATKIAGVGPNMVAIAGPSGLATIKLDPTNPANSLYRVKTTTYDTGWMVLGKTVLAMAESSADLSAIAGGTATDRSGAGNNPNVVGSVTRAQVASGADCAGYGVNGAGGNYFAAPRTAAMDWGSNDFCVVADMVDAGDAGCGVAFQDGVGSLYGTNPGWAITNWNGAPSMQVWDGAGHSAQILPSAGQYNWTKFGAHKVVAQRRGSVIELYVDGVKLGSVSCSSIVTMTNTSAQLLIGAVFYNSAVVGAANKLANVRVFNCSLTPDQIAFMHADEKGRFVANAKELLSGASVQAVAFDPDTGQLAASNSTGGTDVFAGPGFSVRVANWKSSTGSNLLPSAQLPATWTYSGASLGSNVSGPSKWGGGQAWQLLDTVANAQHYATLLNAVFPGTPCTLVVPVKTDAQGFAAVYLRANYGFINLSTGATTNGTATAITSFSLGDGWWLCAVNATPSAGTNPAGYINAATAASVGGLTYAGTGGSAIQFGKPLLLSGTYTATQAAGMYADGLSANDNHKAAAFMGGDLVVATGAGVDAFLGVKPGLRETASGVGAPRRAFYDPTWGQYFGVTTDATPTVFASIPIPEGKAYRFRASVVAVMYGGTATEKAVYDITGVVSRDLGGNVVVVATTTTVSEVTSSMDCVAQANTTAQTLEIKATGKASTRIAWFDGQELYDAGLMAAA